MSDRIVKVVLSACTPAEAMFDDCEERYPFEEEGPKCWLQLGHDGMHSVDGGTYQWKTYDIPI